MIYQRIHVQKGLVLLQLCGENNEFEILRKDLESIEGVKG
jgi:hypothetical protein